MCEAYEKVLGSACLDAVCAGLDRELSECAMPMRSTARHQRIMKKILNDNYRNDQCPMKIRRGIISLICALLSLLAGIAVYAYCNRSSYVIEFITPNGVEYSFYGSAVRDKHIRNQYKPAYVAEGFVLANSSFDEESVIYEYTNASGQYIRFAQMCLGKTVLTLEGDHEEQDEMSVCGYDVRCLYSSGEYHYLFNDGKYALVMTTNRLFTRGEITDMLDGFVGNNS